MPKAGVLAQKFNRITNVESLQMFHISTSPAILPNRCWTKPSVATYLKNSYLNKTKNLIVMVTKKKSWGVKREQINESGEARSVGFWGVDIPIWAHRFSVGSKQDDLWKLLSPRCCGSNLLRENPNGTGDKINTWLFAL